MNSLLEYISKRPGEVFFMKAIITLVLSVYIGFFPSSVFAAWFSDITDEILSSQTCVIQWSTGDKYTFTLTKEGYLVNNQRAIWRLEKVSDELMLVDGVGHKKSFTLKVKKKNKTYIGESQTGKNVLTCF